LIKIFWLTHFPPKNYATQKPPKKPGRIRKFMIKFRSKFRKVRTKTSQIGNISVKKKISKNPTPRRKLRIKRIKKLIKSRVVDNRSYNVATPIQITLAANNPKLASELLRRDVKTDCHLPIASVWFTRVANLIYEYTSSTVNRNCYNGDTALIIALKNKKMWSISHDLLNKTSVNRSNYSKESPLHIITKYKSFEFSTEQEGKQLAEITQSLINNEANVNAKDKFKRTPLHNSAMSLNVDIVQCLLKSKKIKVNVKDKKGQTPLHVLADTNFSSNKSLLQQRLLELTCVEIATCLLEHGAQINAKDKAGNTPLYLAVKNSNLGLVTFLLKNGARDNRALKLAISNKNAELVGFFAEIYFKKGFPKELSNDANTLIRELNKDKKKLLYTKINVLDKLISHEIKKYAPPSDITELNKQASLIIGLLTQTFNNITIESQDSPENINTLIEFVNRVLSVINTINIEKEFNKSLKKLDKFLYQLSECPFAEDLISIHFLLESMRNSFAKNVKTKFCTQEPKKDRYFPQNTGPVRMNRRQYGYNNNPRNYESF
jgi:ankyrin repeat protein